MSTEWIAPAIEALVASALLMVLVLVARVPVRRAFGPGVAYALWALPVLRLILPPLPEGWRGEALPVLPTPEPITIYLGEPIGTLPVVTDGSGIGWGDAALALWIAGAAGFLLWQVVRYFRFRYHVLKQGVAVDRAGSVTIVQSGAASGPMAFGVLDRVVVFPGDFASRFDSRERELALAHELGHHARGDLVANWVALAVLAVHWFNPVAWFAFRAFRADQEMANDARTLAGRDRESRHAYACAIVKAAHGGAIGATCHLHNVGELKGRLRMLARTGASRGRLMAGMVGVGSLTIAALGLTASGTQAAETVRDEVSRATGVDLAALSVPQVPPAPEPPQAPEVPAAPAAAASPEKRLRQVTIVRDGRTTHYEGAEADAYLAANPMPVPPVPPIPPAPRAPGEVPVPPVPPAPPIPDWRGASMIVRNDDCRPANARQPVIHTSERGQRVVIICRNRIDRMASDAAARAVDAEKIAREARITSVERMRAARASLASNRMLSEEGRQAAMQAMDRSIANMEQERDR